MGGRLGIRRTLRPFGAAFGKVMAGAADPGTESVLRRSVDGCLPYVWTIWTCVLAAGLLGVVKPFADL